MPIEGEMRREGEGGERDPFSEEKENLLLAFWIMDVGAGPPVDCPLEREAPRNSFHLSSSIFVPLHWPFSRAICEKRRAITHDTCSRIDCPDF